MPPASSVAEPNSVSPPTGQSPATASMDSQIQSATSQRRRHVIVVGAGFAGLQTARRLSGTELDVTLLDRRSYHLFTPLAYQVATGALSTTDIAVPIRWVFRNSPNVRTLMAEVTSVDLARRRIVAADRELHYDYLVIAAGAESHYFGKRDTWADRVLTLDDLQSTLSMRERIVLCFEAAELETCPERKAALLTFAVIGAGPTGVELSGALAELGRDVLAREYSSFGPEDVRVVLFEAMDNVLPPFPERLRKRAHQQLTGLGVEVRLNTKIEDIEPGCVHFSGGQLRAGTICWGSGVAGSRVAGKVDSPRNGSRLVVGSELSLPDHPEVFAIGDIASCRGKDGKPLPGLAPVALQQGRAVAANILADVRHTPRKPFHYRDRGIMATIGKSRAVARIGGLQLSGFIAWLTWVVVHVAFLVGFRSRVAVILNWAWCYLATRRPSRIVSSEIDTRRAWPAARSDKDKCVAQRKALADIRPNEL